VLVCTVDAQAIYVGDGAMQKIVVFSEATNRVYSLFITAGAPTMLVSGIPMHRAAR